MSHWLLPITGELSNDLFLDFLKPLFDGFDDDSAQRDYLSSLLRELSLSFDADVEQQQCADGH